MKRRRWSWVGIDGCPWDAYHDPMIQDTATFFLQLKELFVMRRLIANCETVNGVEIQQALDPNHIGYSAYWLQKRRPKFDLLVKAGLLEFHYRLSGPRGYGDDELYNLTPAGKAVAGKDDDTIYHEVVRDLLEAEGKEVDDAEDD